MKDLERLLANSGPSLCEFEPNLNIELCSYAGELADELLDMLRHRNGFYALDDALHVYPSHSNQQEIGLDCWNDASLWRDKYEGMADNCLFFAEDIFGGQFCIKDNDIYVFDPETGSLEFLATDIEGWATAIINNYEVLTGYPLAHLWEKQFGKLPPKKRLLPKVPFIMGGDFSLGNLYLADVVEGMKFRADIAQKIKNLPDGSLVKMDITE